MPDHAPTVTRFTLKRTVIGGQTAPDDWSIMLNGETVGQSFPRIGNPPGTDQWQSFVTLPLSSPGHGTAPTFEGAKAG